MTVSVSIAAIMRDERPYILEWVAFHRVVGVTDLTIFDNNSKDGTTDLLQRLHGIGAVNHIRWPAVGESSPQISAYRHYRDLPRSAGGDEWVLYIDADEFAVPVQHDTFPQAVSETLRCAPDARAIAYNWKTFGSSGLKSYEPGLVMERFKRCAEGGRSPNNCVKSLVSLPSLKDPHIHVHQLTDGRYVNEAGDDVEIYGNGMSTTVSHDLVQINHYMTKSSEEWNAKKARGNANLSDDHRQKFARLDDELFQRADRNEVECDRILRFLPKVKAELEHLSGRLEN